MGVFSCRVTDSFLNTLASPQKKFSFLFLKTECWVSGDGGSDMFEGRQKSKVHPRKILAPSNNKLKKKKKRNMEDLTYAFFARRQVKHNNKKQTCSPHPPAKPPLSHLPGYLWFFSALQCSYCTYQETTFANECPTITTYQVSVHSEGRFQKVWTGSFPDERCTPGVHFSCSNHYWTSPWDQASPKQNPQPTHSVNIMPSVQIVLFRKFTPTELHYLLRQTLL